MITSKQKTRSLINKATTNDRNPTSGYLLNELALRCPSISECQTMENLLLKKLSKNEPYTKYKTLRIIKYLSQNGSLHWCRTWQSHKNKLIEAQHFRGPSDPIFGDALNEQVRKAAKEALHSVFEQKQSIYKPCNNPYPSINPCTTKVSNPWFDKVKNSAKLKPKKDRKIIDIKRKKSNNKYEKQWVFDIVQSAGIGTKIHNLSKYVKQFENLNQKYVLKELNKILLDSMWQKQAKALVLIEGLMNGKSCDFVIDYFDERIENIKSLQNSNKSVIRRKANAVIEYLHIEQENDNEISTDTAQIETIIVEQKQKEITPEIIDLFETICVENKNGNEFEKEAEDNNDMFDGMNVTQNENIKIQSAYDGELLDLFTEKEENVNGNVPPNVSNGSAFGLDLHGQSVSAFGIDLNGNNKQQFNPPMNVMTQPYVMGNYMNNNTLRGNDPFAEIMGNNGMCMRTVPNYSQSKPKKQNVDPFAEFAEAVFGVGSMKL